MAAKKWTEQEEEILRQHYPAGGRHEVHKALRAAGYERTVKAVAARAKVLGVKSNNSGRFQPNHQTWNKGKRMPSEVRKKIAHTWFKTGHKPHTTKHDGATSWRQDVKTGIYYKYIRVSEANWVHYHRWLWEKHKGPVPKGYLVAFKDGDQTNLTIENLECISRAEHIKRTHKGGVPSQKLTDNYVAAMLSRYHDTPRDKVTPNMIAIYRAQLQLKRQIKNYTKDETNRQTQEDAE